jgi:hypothetical protein
MIALVLSFFLVGEKSVELRYTEVAPHLGGVIEDVWLQADSAYDFTQYQSSDGLPASEPTIAYFLADDENLYIAFKCYTPGRRPYASLLSIDGQSSV